MIMINQLHDVRLSRALQLGRNGWDKVSISTFMRNTRILHQVRSRFGCLRQTRLVTLEARRTRADIIEVFTIMKGLEGLNREDFF